MSRILSTRLYIYLSIYIILVFSLVVVLGRLGSYLSIFIMLVFSLVVVLGRLGTYLPVSISIYLYNVGIFLSGSSRMSRILSTCLYIYLSISIMLIRSLVVVLGRLGSYLSISIMLVRSLVVVLGRLGTLTGSCSLCTAFHQGRTPARSRRTGCSPRR